MMQPPFDFLTLKPGKELDALVATRVCGTNLIPPLEYRQAKVALSKVQVTGSVMQLFDGRKISVPSGDSLHQPWGSSDFNDRYYLYIAQQLGEEIAAEVEAYRDAAMQFSTDLECAWPLLDKFIAENGARVSVHNRAVGPWACSIILNWGHISTDQAENTERHIFQYGEQPAHAISLASLAAVDALKILVDGK